MTNDDIVKAAFRAWGRDLYKTTSLSLVAEELAVSKAALYRHFPNKDALLEAQYAFFYEDYARAIRESYQTALLAENEAGLLCLLHSVVIYYARNPEAFVFALIQVYRGRHLQAMLDRLREKDIDMDTLIRRWSPNDQYPRKMHFATVTACFWLGLYHAARFHQDYFGLEDFSDVSKVKKPESPEEVAELVEAWVFRGLALPPEEPDFAALEARLPPPDYTAPADSELLKAVGQAVAQAGPWNATMEMVASRSGLSKSGLYSHFRNKRDMMARLFRTEFEEMVRYAGACIALGKNPPERLYLAILGAADYLRGRPEIRTAMEWARRLDLEPREHPHIRWSFPGIDLEVFNQKATGELVSQWILFLIVTTLVWRAELPPGSLRTLYRMVAYGVAAPGF